MKKFQLISNPEIGFAIEETNVKKYNKKTKSLEKTGKKLFVLWIDKFEGGEAYLPDWDCVDEFKSESEAMDFIKKAYGEVKEIED